MTNFDMTFCSSDCTNTLCERHQDNIDQYSDQPLYISLADFSIGCEYYEPEMQEDNEKELDFND